MVKQLTCFKNLENPTRIDHILTNHPKSFHSSNVYERGLPDFHKVFHAQPGEFEKFRYFSTKVLNIHAPIKEKHVRCNQSAFMNKQLRKPIMTRTRLLNKYRKDNSVGNLFSYKRQKNLCVKLLRKSKKDFYNNLHVKRINNNRKFWQTIKPNFTNKTLKDERITLADGDKVTTEEKDQIVETLKLTFPYCLI